MIWCPKHECQMAPEVCLSRQNKERCPVSCQHKHAPIRLKGKALRRLYEDVYERDEGWCVWCLQEGKKRRVPRGTIPHHIIFKSQGGSDTSENLVTLCPVCHGEAHGLNVKEG